MGRFTQQFRAGSALEHVFSTWSKNAPAFVGISLLFNLPTILLTIWAVTAVDGYAEFTTGEVEGLGTGYDAQTVFGVQMSIALLNLLLSMVVTGAICHAAFQHLRGETPDMGASTKRGLQRLLVLCLTTICAGLLSAVIVGLAMIPMFVLGAILGGLGSMLGMIFVGAVGLFVLAAIYPAVPAAAVESIGPVQAVQRGWDLSKGKRMSIIGVLLVLGIAGFIVNLMISLVVIGVLGVAIGAIVLQLVAVVIASVASTAQAVCYHDIRVDKEGLGENDLVNVFA